MLNRSKLKKKAEPENTTNVRCHDARCPVCHTKQQCQWQDGLWISYDKLQISKTLKITHSTIEQIQLKN